MKKQCGFGMLCPVFKAVGIHGKCMDDKKPVKSTVKKAVKKAKKSSSKKRR